MIDLEIVHICERLHETVPVAMVLNNEIAKSSINSRIVSLFLPTPLGVIRDSCEKHYCNEVTCNFEKLTQEFYAIVCQLVGLYFVRYDPVSVEKDANVRRALFLGWECCMSLEYRLLMVTAKRLSFLVFGNGLGIPMEKNSSGLLDRKSSICCVCH